MPPDPTSTAPTIRAWSRDDADALFEAVRESVDVLAPWLPWCHPDYRIEETIAWLAFCDAEAATGRGHHFAIHTASGRLAGAVGLSEISARHRSANLGYWVRRSMLRRGLATAAVRLAADFAFRQLGLLRLEIAVLPENLPSTRVAERADARLEGVARNRIVIGGEARDALMYSLVPDAR
jgi:ribosomal-protein-serine acetyltransferase